MGNQCHWRFICTTFTIDTIVWNLIPKFQNVPVANCARIPQCQFTTTTVGMWEDVSAQE